MDQNPRIKNTIDICSIDKNITQYLWDKSQLGRSWSLGNDMYLIKESKATTFGKWERWYEKSGRTRRIKIANLRPAEQKIPDNFSLITLYPNGLEKYVPKEIVDINYFNGRDRESLWNIAATFKIFLKANGYKDEDINDEMLYYCVFMHSVVETWIGFERELGVIHYLRRKFNNFKYEFSTGEDDNNYGVDIWVKKRNKLVSAIQVKPVSYFLPSSNPIREKETVNYRLQNIRKIEKVKKEKGVDLRFIIASRDGTICSSSFLHNEFIGNNGFILSNNDKSFSAISLIAKFPVDFTSGKTPDEILKLF